MTSFCRCGVKECRQCSMTAESVPRCARAAGGPRGQQGEQWLVIGISGVTCGGKTTLANRLLNLLVPVYVFHQDQYFYPDDSSKHVKCDGLDHNNYDILGALDMERFHRDVLSTLSGTDRCHESNTEREPGKTEVKGKRFLILEGFTVLNYQPLNDLCNLRYYLTLEYGECAFRRSLRLYDPPDVPGYFDRCVWPEHVSYRAKIEQDPRITIIEGKSHDTINIVINDLKKLGAVSIT